MARYSTNRRRICFVTGTRAEFGLMESTLRAIGREPSLQLQTIATGMHLDRSRGHTLRQLRDAGWSFDATVPWPAGGAADMLAIHTGGAIAKLARELANLQSEIVLVVGDRVEAFAAATAAHLSGRIVAHVHGGDRALGQVDDSLRHAITKLSHIHFPATAQSAERLSKLGEEAWRIHRVGSPGLDGIHQAAVSRAELRALFPEMANKPFVLLSLHPVSADVEGEYRQANCVLDATLAAGAEHIVLIHPNNDPGAAGIMKCWRERRGESRLIQHANVERGVFLGLLREAQLLVGNSSAGIIEAASFGTPVLDIGPRQQGRERNESVIWAPYRAAVLRQHLRRLLALTRPASRRGANLYGIGNTSLRIATILRSVRLDEKLRRKLIAY